MWSPGFYRQHHIKLGIVLIAYNLGTQEMERTLGIQGHSQLLRISEASLGDMRPCLLLKSDQHFWEASGVFQPEKKEGGCNVLDGKNTVSSPHFSGRTEGYLLQSYRAADSQEVESDPVLKMIYVAWRAALWEEENVD